MVRHSVTQAIVLHVYHVGEIHKGVNLLTKDRGIIFAIAHGAKNIKSRLRSATEPFCISKVYLYYDPVKNSYKITDIQIQKVFVGIRENLIRYYTACLWTEVIIKSFGGGEINSNIYNLFTGSLKLLDRMHENMAHYISFQFLWRFIYLSGSNPGLDKCENCDRSFDSGEYAYLKVRTLSFLCEDCAGRKGVILSPGSRRYLLHTSKSSMDKAVMVGLDRISLSGLKKMLYTFIQGMLEVKLKTIEHSGGLI